MKLKFYLKTALFAFCAATQSFASVHAAVDTNTATPDVENARVLAGMNYITQQDTTRCTGFNAQPVETMQNSPETNKIINLLSDKAKVSAREATANQKQVIATSVMGTIIVHGQKRLKRLGLTEGDANFRHFRALELIEDLSFELNGNLIDQGEDKVVNQSWLSGNWATYRDLETYSKITAELFELWFNEALKEHKPGLVVLAEIKQEEHRIELEAIARVEFEKAQKTAAEVERLRLKKIKDDDEAALILEKKNREEAEEIERKNREEAEEIERKNRAAAEAAKVVPNDGEKTPQGTAGKVGLFSSQTGRNIDAKLHSSTDSDEEDSSAKEVKKALDFDAAATDGASTDKGHSDVVPATPQSKKNGDEIPSTPQRIVHAVKNATAGQLTIGTIFLSLGALVMFKILTPNK